MDRYKKFTYLVLVIAFIYGSILTLDLYKQQKYLTNNCYREEKVINLTVEKKRVGIRIRSRNRYYTYLKYKGVVAEVESRNYYNFLEVGDVAKADCALYYNNDTDELEYIYVKYIDGKFE